MGNSGNTILQSDVSAGAGVLERDSTDGDDEGDLADGYNAPSGDETDGDGGFGVDLRGDSQEFYDALEALEAIKVGGLSWTWFFSSNYSKKLFTFPEALAHISASCCDWHHQALDHNIYHQNDVHSKIQQI